MASVVDPKPRYGQVSRPDFTIIGDMLAAYEYLKSYFEAPQDNQSGPIKPLTELERHVEANKPVVDMLKELPSSEY